MNRDHFRTARQLASLRAGRNDWFRIVNQADGPHEVHIYDEIGYFGVTAQDFINDLRGVTGPLALHLNTPGGLIFDGVAIYEYLAERGQVGVVVDSLAASIGSVIAQAAAPGQLVMGRASMMMIHEGHGLVIGGAADMRQQADIIDKLNDTIAGIYADRTGQPADHWRELMAAETWFTSAEAVDAGLADAVKGKGKAPEKNSWDLSIYGNPPGKKRKAGPANASVDESAWDASRAWHNGASADNPAAFYRGICAGHRSGMDDSTQGAWALPHHYHPGDAPNRHGVSAALGRLSGTDGIDQAAARSHLEAHQRAYGGGDADNQAAGDPWAIDPDLVRQALQGV